MFELNVFQIKRLINKTIESGLGIKCLMYKMVSLMSYVMYNTKSVIKGFVCIFVVVDRLTKLLPELSMRVLLPLLCVVFSFNCHIQKLFLLGI